MTPVDHHDLVSRAARVRVLQQGRPDVVLNEGVAIAHSVVPMILIRDDDGREKWYPVTQPMVERDSPESDVGRTT